jgi:hypothetical protein
MKEALREGMEVPVVKDVVMDPNGGNPIKVCTKSCYACGEEGHISQDCTKKGTGYLGEFPIAEVEYDPQEIEDLIGTKKTKKRKQRPPQNNPFSVEKDLGHIICFKCKKSGHYFDRCPEKKLKIQGAYIITKKPRDMSEVICFRCKEAGHFARECSDQKKA